MSGYTRDGEELAKQQREKQSKELAEIFGPELREDIRMSAPLDTLPSNTGDFLRGRDFGQCPYCHNQMTGLMTSGGFVPDLHDCRSSKQPESANDQACQATPPDVLMRRLRDPGVGKTQLEHFAARLIADYDRDIKALEMTNEGLASRVKDLERRLKNRRRNASAARKRGREQAKTIDRLEDENAELTERWLTRSSEVDQLKQRIHEYAAGMRISSKALTDQAETIERLREALQNLRTALRSGCFSTEAVRDIDAALTEEARG